MVHIRELESSNFTCQNPDDASKVEKYLAPERRGTTSSKPKPEDRHTIVFPLGHPPVKLLSSPQLSLCFCNGSPHLRIDLVLSFFFSMRSAHPEDHTAVVGVSYLALLLATVPTVFGDKPPPDIVLIIADDLGWDDVSFHGSSQIPTSNLDALAADGVILNALYAMPACTPSRSALMSGRYPIRIGTQGAPLMVGEPWGLPQDVPILPEYLKELGYETHLVGKWHLGAHKRNLTPTYRGFDSFYGFLYGEEDYYTHSVSYLNYTGLDFWFGTEPRWCDDGKYSTTLYTERAKYLIRNKQKPLFLVLAHQAPHGSGGPDPLQAPQANVD
ncbi:hypothetical protein MTO96_051902, partial [Rhipicephalus appendiculatus]